MGDGGSYFLGYMLAGLSILGSMKGQTTVALMIPVVAMGVPLIDAIIAPIRRFVFPYGFSADCLLYCGQVNIPICVDKVDQWQNHFLKKLKKFWQKQKDN